MCGEKTLKNGNGEKAEGIIEANEEVEGYAYCNTTRQKCLNDCHTVGRAPSFLSTLN